MLAYLIDASIYIFQAHFSPHVECIDSEGEDLSALYGFSQFLLQFLRRENPQVIAIAMDQSLFSGFRHQLCPNYKSNRELPDKNLARQLAACAELCEVFGLANFASRKYEADDIIGTLARRLREEDGYQNQSKGRTIGIVSRDKDLAQLVLSDSEFVWDYQKNKKRYSADIYKDFGVYPAQIPDYLGLIGDAVDNISGVPGLGPVKGRHLLQEFVTMDAIYQDIARVSSLSLRGAARLARMLDEYKDQAYLSKQLATIVDDVVDTQEHFSVVGLNMLNRRPVDTKRLAEFLIAEKFDSRFQNSMVAAANRLNENFK